MTNIKVFEIEFDGIDKCGKDTLVHTMFKVFPNRCAYQSRGLLSQIAYSKLYNRAWNYPVTEGYIKNSLFVKLEVDQEDWLKRLKDSNEIEANNNRSDVDFVFDYEKQTKAFADAWNELKSLDVAKDYQDHFICYSTSKLDAVSIAKDVANVIKSLNNIEEE